jgi:dihydrodipicolinate synthase/N-acetylneuraminate lyase
VASNFNRRHALKLLALALLSSQLDAGTDKPLGGIFPIMATPYSSSNQVDYEDLEKEVEFMTRCGANGMVWPQHASELLYLSREERRRGMRVLAKAIKGKKPALVLGVQAATKEDAVEYAELAEELSPDAVIAIPPTVAKSLDDYRDYYRTLARISKRPFFIQTSGGVPGVNPTVDFLIEMARELPNFGYVKEECNPIFERVHVLATARPPIRAVFTGPFDLYAMRVGCDGCMPGPVYPDIDVQIWDLYHSGGEEKAREIFSKRLLMVNAEQNIPGIRPYIMKKRGVFKTALSRRESPNLTADAIREIDFEFEGLKPYFKLDPNAL